MDLQLNDVLDTSGGPGGFFTPGPPDGYITVNGNASGPMIDAGALDHIPFDVQFTVVSDGGMV